MRKLTAVTHTDRMQRMRNPAVLADGICILIVTTPTNTSRLSNSLLPECRRLIRARRDVALGFYAQVHATSHATVVKMAKVSFDSLRQPYQQ